MRDGENSHDLAFPCLQPLCGAPCCGPWLQCRTGVRLRPLRRLLGPGPGRGPILPTELRLLRLRRSELLFGLPAGLRLAALGVGLWQRRRLRLRLWRGLWRGLWVWRGLWRRRLRRPAGRALFWAAPLGTAPLFWAAPRLGTLLSAA